MQTIFTNEYLIIKADPKASILYWEWTPETEALTDEKFIALAQKIMHTASELKYHNAIDNALNFRFAVSVSLQKLIADSMFSNDLFFANRLAHVYSTEIISLLSQQQVWGENKDKKYEEKYFEHLDEALDWIRN